MCRWSSRGFFETQKPASQTICPIGKYADHYWLCRLWMDLDPRKVLEFGAQ